MKRMKNEKLDFLIMYEVTTRELESIVLLGNELKKRGFSVEYLSFEHAYLKKYVQNRKYIRRYHDRVEVVLTPSLYHDKELYELIYYVCGDCKNVVNLRWEQVFTVKTEKDYDSYHYPHGDAKLAYHLCWGQASVDNMIKTGVDKSKLILAGPLHMDFLRDEFNGYYYSRNELLSKYNIPIDKRCVLYISSFALATRTERQMELEEESAGATLFNNKVIVQQKKTREKTLEWIEELLKREECTFIYRPHPVENVLEDLKELETKYDHFRVISELPVKQWILGCDVVTTWVSTSIAEAFYAKKDFFIARPYPILPENEMTLYEDAKVLETKEQFLESISRKPELPVSRKIMQYYYDCNEVASYIRLSDALENILKNEEDRFPWDKKKSEAIYSKKAKYIVQSLLIYLYIPIMNLLGVLREKTGISWGNLNGRIDSFRKQRKVIDTKLVSDEVIEEYSKRISKIIS